MPSLLFVCTANRFRSVLCEAIFIRMLANTKVGDNWLVGSVGTWTKDGLPPTKEAVEIAVKMG
ncbi:MAG: hypothetical protein MUO40_07570, partial [Anaerolineaceae bacterium]|nr:hypothetical protein [Anaerolineaceae bacterium]